MVEDGGLDEEAAVAPFKGVEEDWPNLYEEAHEMLEAAVIMYAFSKLRRLAKNGELDDGPTVQNVMEMPVTLHDIIAAIKDNKSQLESFEGKLPDGSERVDLHISLFESIRSRDFQVSDTDVSKVMVFDDKNCERELVYAIVLDEARRRVVVAFRGSDTTNDWFVNTNAIPTYQPNPVLKMEDVVAEYPNQKKKIMMHRGWYRYLFAAPSKNESCKYDTIMSQAIDLLKEHPGYKLYVTGHSLGGALTTIFSFYAAASTDPHIIKPVTCVSLASPKVGAISFRRAFQALEETGYLRCLRVATNNDPVTNIPREISTIFSYDLSLSITILLNQRRFYRHVGMELKLFVEGGYCMSHPKVADSCLALWKGDVKNLTDRNNAICCCIFKCVRNAGKNSNIRVFHSYPEYARQLELNQEELEKLTLNGLYKMFQEDDTSIVETHYH